MIDGIQFGVIMPVSVRSALGVGWIGISFYT
jgi:hypothetical protein